MAELDNNAQFMQGGIDDAFIPPALKFDFIYQYMTNVDWKYLAQIPSYKQPAYMLKRLWLLLANGFVPEWHNTFIPTKLANTTLNTINRKIFSGALHYELGDDLLDMLGEDIEKTTAVRFHAKKITRNQNFAKAALFLVGVAFMTIFSWAPTWTGIVY